MNEPSTASKRKSAGHRAWLSDAASWAAILGVPVAVISVVVVVWQIRDTQHAIANGVTAIATPANGSATRQYMLAAGGTLSESDSRWQGAGSVLVVDVCSTSEPGVPHRCWPQSTVTQIGTSWTALIRIGAPDATATDPKLGALYLVRLDHLSRARWNQLTADTRHSHDELPDSVTGHLFKVLSKQVPLAQAFVTRD